MDKKFSVPVVLFLFKRLDSVLQIIDVLRKIQPKKLYLISDYGRNNDECTQIDINRTIIENYIDWECIIIKKYHSTNVGVYSNIALGAKWVFQQENIAIFLEDDNLPDITFFRFCDELLKKYYTNEKILWICGSNYLITSDTCDNSSYFFSQNMLPCGWASWGHKFNKFYDGELSLFNKKKYGYMKKTYTYIPLYYQDMYNLKYELDHKAKYNRFFSWDYQMSFSIRHHNLLTIIPKYNLIKNIGVDDNSIHGGSTIHNTMTARFCENHTHNLSFPLIHPENILIDKTLDRKIAKIIFDPYFFSIKAIICRIVKKIFNINLTESLTAWLKNHEKNS
ncbi:hemolytic protein HlpA [Wohlfahrtiimonas chitiniclastica]|uniref:hemolytic protein HlpA n=1 Tax=Wohlfahrtiimonas chitiniclastica TaxID=400946 RepID=UPI000B98CA2B|nr:hemolytic protein HlpA [Wohlfahrtiimonas chitiniclastica]OYQ70487.1 hemolytic protein HlpA [Wohlfahrtiimonas chitiniclastica]OYQ88807.1 hemolytic protein HlpA [Wohlfahrtiimonas chitiniclastica]